MVIVSYTYDIKGCDALKEIWKDIKGYEGLYQISNLGRVRSLPGWRGNAKRKGGIRKTSITKDGYVRVTLTQDCKYKTMRVHRLVAEAFIPNPNGGDTVNHIDGNKQNNRVDNLEWLDRHDQMYHAYALGLKTSRVGSENANAKLTPDQVREIRSTYVRNSQEFGTVALARKYGVTNAVIGKIVRNETYKNVK